MNTADKSATFVNVKAVKIGSRSDNKSSKNVKTLEKQLKYIVPQIRSILVREPDIKPTHIADPGSFYDFVKPLALHPDEYFVAFHL